MHRRILLRSRKEPFEVNSVEVTGDGDLLGTNSGNIVFSAAAHKLLQTPQTEITSTRFLADRRAAHDINERYDVFVIPLANAFRLTFIRQLTALTRLIERLKIPVVVLGVGAQCGLDYKSERLKPVEPMVHRFVRAVLDRGPSIGVRGECTEAYLKSLGYADVEQIGCPSMFMYGDRLNVEKRVPELTGQSRVAINITPYVKAMGKIALANHARYPHLTYIAQDIATMQTLLYGDTAADAGKSSDIPIYTSHPFFREDRVRLFTDPWPWLDYLRGVDFSFGTRIHGNITSLITGTPSVVLAHDSRTLELCRYFGIPHHPVRDVPIDVDAATLYAEADYTELNRGHAERFARFTDFMRRHDLEHTFAYEGSPEAFEATAAATPFPPGLGPAESTSPAELVRRVRHLKDRNTDLSDELIELRRSMVVARARRALVRRLGGVLNLRSAASDPTIPRESAAGRRGASLPAPLLAREPAPAVGPGGKPTEAGSRRGGSAPAQTSRAD